VFLALGVTLYILTAFAKDMEIWLIEIKGVTTGSILKPIEMLMMVNDNVPLAFLMIFWSSAYVRAVTLDEVGAYFPIWAVFGLAGAAVYRDNPTKDLLGRAITSFLSLVCMSFAVIGVVEVFGPDVVGVIANLML
jgi:hypothetical protein